MALLSDDFEVCNLDAWSGTKTHMSCSDEQPHGGTYSLKVFWDETGYGAESIYRDFTATEKITIVFYIRFIGLTGDVTGLCHLYGLTGGAKPITSIGVRASTANLCDYYDGSYHDFCAVVINTYYKITIEVDGSTKKYRILVDDVEKRASRDWRDTGAGNPERWYFCAQKGTCRTKYYADDLNIEETSVVKPSSSSIVPLMRLMGLIDMVKRFPKVPKFTPFVKSGIG